MLRPKSLFFYDIDDSGGGGGGNPPADSTSDPKPDRDGALKVPHSWDEYVETLPEPVKNMYEDHVRGLKNTVEATRQERDTFRQRMTGVLESLGGKDPDVIKQEIEQLNAALGEAQQRGVFFEEAAHSDRQCRNPELAFLVAKSKDLFKRNGKPDWEAIQTNAPELFGPRHVDAAPGSGTQNPPSDNEKDFNDWIRAAAGYRAK